MRHLKWMLLSLITALSVSSCFIDIDDDGGIDGCIRGQGAIVSEEMELNRIDAIDLNLPATVYLRQGNEQSVEVEGQANIIDYMETTVKGGLWEIEMEDRCVRDMEDLRIFITVPELTSVRISGSGEVFGETQLLADDVDLEIAGSGNINLGLEADDIEAGISGSGNMRLDGIVDEIRFTVGGSGDLKAFGLQARKATIDITGSGDVEVFVTEELSVSISGSGDVLYHGNPSLNVSVSGSGEVVDAN